MNSEIIKKNERGTGMNSKKVNSVLKGVAVAGATIGGVSSIQGADVDMAGNRFRHRESGVDADGPILG